MKRLLCIAVLCGWGFAGQASSQDKLSSDNLAGNPSFEKVDKEDKLTFWKPVKDGYQISRDLFYTGKQSVMVKGKDIVGGVCGTIDVPRPGCKLIFKVHVYIKNFKSGILKPIHVSYASGGKVYYRPQVNIFPDQKNIRYNTWVEYKAVLDLSKNPDVDKVVFWCLGYAHKKYGKFEGEVYWDDVSVEEGDNMYSIKLDTIRKGYRKADYSCWIIPTVSPLDAAGKKILLCMRKGEIHKPGRWDIFSSPYQMLSNDGGKSWTKPVPAKGLENLISGDHKYVFNGNPKLHRKTGKCLMIGNRGGYKNNSIEYSPRKLEYSVLDMENLIWSKPATLTGMDFAEKLTYNGGMQRVELQDGDILLPVYGNVSKGDRYFSMVVRCGFDGRELKVKELGPMIKLDVERGICEPSLTCFQGGYYLTLRNDLAGYVAVGKDGLHFSTPVKWRFDDGSELGSYNTQQHWVKHGGKLFLVYTRKGADNEHMAIVRHRAPLFIAEVDPQKLCVIRKTERIIVPERGAKLGNFDVVDINERETWVVVAEWMEERPQLVSSKYGSDNSVFACRLIWRK